MSLQRYAAYRDSGIDWLGDMPAHWQVRRLRFAAEFNPSKSEVSHLDRDTLVSFLPMDAIGEEGSLVLEQVRQVSQVETGYTYFHEGDVAFAKITPCFENGKGAVMRGLLGGVGFGTTELIVARPRSDVTCSEYLHWLFCSIPFRKLGEGAMYGAGGQKRVPEDFARDFAIAFPPLSEQNAIVTFLYSETSKIDTLISEQDKLLVLLAEKRQATISRIVTRGLEPKVQIKSVGADWLGEIPIHWQAKRVKWLTSSIEQGWSPQCENYPAEGENEWGVLKVGCVNGGVFDAAENKKLPPELEPFPEYSLRKGDLLISRANTRELVGSAAVVPKDFHRLLLCDKLYRLRLDQAKCTPEFLAAYLATGEARGQIELGATGASSSMLNIGQSVIMDLLVPLPPAEEQAAIMDFLNAELDRLERLSLAANKSIDLLKARRTALITAAVTGKIDVRNAVPDTLAA
ncbi:restriction endonuclease subunit S [Cupriavidus taiwanensis]|uniref:Type I restriction-modification methylase S subunit n=1 Tax=Cupriavidus taiwanensis (strain DSM 17343 / BCRC 17206 / CCUG 44338 / CIP 107171 / LMG 19424 / R1) TaxID=977880 RepID=B3R3C2_CUPTR|nr:restriction endonuclease subunit S [Cupriavidus taiwanensis]CAQ68804.1 type I restriction-modification methylase S subunit [Cupriavidus taiwanensis LMG 19424]